MQRSIEGVMGFFVIPTFVSPWRRRAWLSFGAGAAAIAADGSIFLLSARLGLPFENLSYDVARAVYVSSFLLMSGLFGFAAVAAFNAITEPPTRGRKNRLHTAALAVGPMISGVILAGATAVGAVFAMAN